MAVDFVAAGEGILPGLKPGLLRACNHQGSRFISTQGRLAFDSGHLRLYCATWPPPEWLG